MPKRLATTDPHIIMYADGTFYLRIGDNERSLRTKDFKRAVVLKQKMLAKLDRTGERSGRLKVEDVWGDYVAFRALALDPNKADPSDGPYAKRRRRTIAPNTFKEINSVWKNQLKGFWSLVRLDKIDEEKWEEYVQYSLAIDLANPRKVFSGFLKWSKTKKYIKYVPDMPIPAVDRRERRVLKPFEIRKLFEHAKGGLLLYLSCYLFMGMRRKEIMTLRWDSINFEEHYLILRKSEVKTRRGRALPINDYVLQMLRQKFNKQQIEGLKSPYVYPNLNDPKRHGDVGGLKGSWTRVREKCGFPVGYITPHDLRATFEAYAHKAVEFTDTQREKFAGAAIDVQKKTYVRFDASDIKGLEEVVKVEGLEKILSNKLTGNGRGETKQGNLH